MNFNFVRAEKKESDEEMCVYLNMPGVKEEDVKVDLQTDTLMSFQAGKIHHDNYFGAFMNLPDNVVRNTCMFKKEILQDDDNGMLKLTLPKLKGNSHKTSSSIFSNIITKLRFRYSLRFYDAIISFIMPLARPILLGELCPQLYDSFTMCRIETPQSLHVSIAPGLRGKMDSVTRGLCVSLNMPELNNIQDVKSFSKYNAFFVQGKTKTKTNKVQYTTGIHLPHFYHRRRSMIKEEMQDGIYKAFIPIVD